MYAEERRIVAENSVFVPILNMNHETIALI